MSWSTPTRFHEVRSYSDKQLSSVFLLRFALLSSFCRKHRGRQTPPSGVIMEPGSEVFHWGSWGMFQELVPNLEPLLCIWTATEPVSGPGKLPPGSSWLSMKTACVRSFGQDNHLLRDQTKLWHRFFKNNRDCAASLLKKNQSQAVGPSSFPVSVCSAWWRRSHALTDLWTYLNYHKFHSI